VIISQFWTNTRRKTFSLFFYSMRYWKEKRFTATTKKHIQTTTTINKQTQKQKKTKKIQTQNKKHQLKLRTTFSFIISHMVYWLSRCSLYTVHVSCNCIALKELQFCIWRVGGVNCGFDGRKCSFTGDAMQSQ